MKNTVVGRWSFVVGRADIAGAMGFGQPLTTNDRRYIETFGRREDTL